MFAAASLSSFLLLLLPLASAHFELEWPTVRGFDEDTLTKFPCGGQDTVSSKRTPWPLKGPVPIQLNMGHDESAVQVLLGMGNDPGENFNVIVVPTFEERGLQEFCMGDVQMPDDLGLKAGMNATIQVVTNGDPEGGLYNCADITFTDEPLTDAMYDDHCTNSTDIETQPIEGDAVNANGTVPFSTATTDGSPSSSSGLAAQATVAGWIVGAAGVFGGLAAL